MCLTHYFIVVFYSALINFVFTHLTQELKSPIVQIKKCMLEHVLNEDNLIRLDKIGPNKLNFSIKWGNFSRHSVQIRVSHTEEYKCLLKLFYWDIPYST